MDTIITMTAEQFDREKSYGAAVAIAKALHAKGLIDEKEYGKVEAMLIKKYRPLLGGLQIEKP